MHDSRLGTDAQAVNAPTDRDAATANGAEKSTPRANALRHGLTASKLLPVVLRSDRLAEIKSSLRAQYQPTTATQELFVCEAARHMALLEVLEEAEPAVLRQAALALGSTLSQQDAAVDLDFALAAAVSTEPLERVARYRRSHELAAYRALDWLQESQATEQVAPPASPAAGTASGGSVAQVDLLSAADLNLDTSDIVGAEANCEVFLRQRFDASDWACPHCRGAKGHWLAARKVWECLQCKVQFSLRSGTLFAKSPLPLKTWFLAIRAYLRNSRITAQQLSDVKGVKRLTTTRAMIARMRAALRGDDVDRQFAGLLQQPRAGVRVKTSKRSI